MVHCLRLLQCVVLLAVAALSVDSARILSILPLPARSHSSMFEAILTTLANRGHHVVSYSPYPLTKPVANYTVIHVDLDVTMKNIMTLDRLHEMRTCSQIAAFVIAWENLRNLVPVFLKEESVIKLFQSEEQYDIIILEPFFGQEMFLGLGHKFNAPVVAVQPFGSFSLSNAAAGNSHSLSYIPDFSFPYSDHMSIYERFINAYSKLKTLYYWHTQHLPLLKEQMVKLYNDPTMPPLADMIQNISLYLNNAHPYGHYAQPYTPNMVQIGGIHLAKEQNPLPDDIKNFMDNAKEGVIFFSLGSMVPDHHMPQTYFDNFLKAFRRLPQRVVWKIAANLSGLPDNVMTVMWAPQQDILAHPNTVLFMTHGGLFSQHEAINAGVPIVCIPFFGDQLMNARFYEEKEVGVELPFKSLSEETIYSAITKVLNTPLYKDNMRRLSAIYRDRPVSPADSLVFWVEYVLRHRGAHHLRPASADMAWYQLVLLDAIAFVIVVLFLALMAIYLFVRYTYQMMCFHTNGSASFKHKLN